MTEEEIINKRKELVDDLSAKRKAYAKAERNLREFEKEISYGIAKGYEQFVGKKVVIYYIDHMGIERNTEVGYLDKFTYIWNVSGIKDGLYPFLSKVKKDGSKSSQYYPLCDNTKAEMQKITKIVEI